MPTNTFDRKLEITDPDSIRKLIQVMASEPVNEPLSKHPYSQQERERSVLLLKECLSRSKDSRQ